MNRAEERLSCRLPRLHHTTLEYDTMRSFILAAEVLLFLVAVALAAAFATLGQFGRLA